MTPLQPAFDLLFSGRPAQAVEMLERLANAGETSAWLELGLLFLAGGNGIARDLPRARHYMIRSAEAGDPQGTEIAASFLAIGLGAPPDWASAVAMLDRARSIVPSANAQLALIEAMDLDADGNPRKLRAGSAISERPQVVSIADFATAEECAYLIERAQPRLKPSTVVDPTTGQLKMNPVRTSDAAVFPYVLEDLVIHALNRRMAAASGTVVGAGEPLNVIRYRPGEQYRPHFDSYDSSDNQRLWTMLVYLNDDFEGGDTVFNRTGLRIRAEKGKAILFRNASDEGVRDDWSQHAGEPVESGEKYIASRWIRAKSIAPQ